MTWIEQIEKIYIENFKEIFEKLNFTRYEEKDGPGMGALIKFNNGLIKIQLLNDRGIIETEISPALDAEQFRGIELFYSLVKLQNSKNFIGGLERRKILGSRIDFEDQKSFLVDNIEIVQNLLDRNNYRKTILQIDELGQERFNNMF